jgi:hypothetical protein
MAWNHCCGYHGYNRPEEKEVKLNFSGISTEELREAVKNAGDSVDYDEFCYGIPCGKKCPFSGKSCTINADERRKAFKEELNRREKDMNEMPELKAGMLIEVFDREDNETYGLYLYINDEWLINIDSSGYISLKNHVGISKIYNTELHSFNHITDDSTLIWSRKSDNDIKIEEIEKTINNMDQEHIKRSEELRRQIEGLKA